MFQRADKIGHIVPVVQRDEDSGMTTPSLSFWKLKYQKQKTALVQLSWAKNVQKD